MIVARTPDRGQKTGGAPQVGMLGEGGRVAGWNAPGLVEASPVVSSLVASSAPRRPANKVSSSSSMSSSSSKSSSCKSSSSGPRPTSSPSGGEKPRCPHVCPPSPALSTH